MGGLARFVFDSYDDIEGRVLRGLAKSPDHLPDFIKTAERLTEDRISNLPDDQFALVIFDEGQKLKKYATVDKGNTALSVMYLLKQAHLLPPTAVKVAAQNLLAACEEYELDVPMALKVAAATGVSGLSGKSKKPYVKGAKVSKIQFPMKEAPGEFTTNPQLGQGDHNEHDLVERTNFNGPQGSNFLESPIFSQKEKMQNSGMEGQEKRAFVTEFANAPENNADRRTKHKAWKEVPYVALEGWDPNDAMAKEASAAPSRTLLNGKYPVDSMSQVKEAMAYFEEYRRKLEPADRHTYCVKLASRMAELNMPVPEEIARYGAETYGADAESMVLYRRGIVEESLVPALDALLEKRAQVPPLAFASALEQFDKLAGLNWEWDSKVPDPYFSTFGPSIEKLAELSWSWDQNGARVDLQDLEHLARNGKSALKKQFGNDFMESFAKNPKTVFESMPTPNKLMLARLAMSRHDGTATE